MGYSPGIRVGLIWVIVGLWACGPEAHTPEGVARGFMDRYYVAIDLRGARELCTGLALSKIDQQLELTKGVEISPDTRKPKVRYRLLTVKEGGPSSKLFVFEGEIQVSQGGTSKKRCLVILREQGGKWKVSHFADQDI
ncbi:MAG: hypothetical protein HYY20_07120 [Candidatus Tectomicrobia bacterium]|uniref:Uncharacterized protein n=1 Tax=Tectimicrobiota bacterium TaxID=2528274 RepID=A0A932CPE4_UNCTE|nr:hypothetical protein [Candidatus Tectomicrobia bacterium]